MIDLQNKLGRSPSRNDARAELGDGFTSAAERLYGSWNAAKLAFDIVGYRPGGEARAHSREAVLASMQAFYEVHNRLPSAKEAQRRDRLPVTPSYPSVLRAMGAETWRDAMERVASFLDIHGGKYGLPVKAVAAA